LHRLSGGAGRKDALVVTAGIGERSPEIRRRICEMSASLGVAIDPAANAAPGTPGELLGILR
jgi:acetate kinase